MQPYRWHPKSKTVTISDNHSSSHGSVATVPVFGDDILGPIEFGGRGEEVERVGRGEEVSRAALVRRLVPPRHVQVHPRGTSAWRCSGRHGSDPEHWRKSELAVDKSYISLDSGIDSF